MNTMTFEEAKDAYLKMSTSKFFGHWQCRKHNQKIISAASFAAMEAVFEQMTKRADAEELHFAQQRAAKLAEIKKLDAENPKRKREESDDEDPRIRAGTHEYKYTKHKCGGKGQVQLVREIVRVEASN